MRKKRWLVLLLHFAVWTLYFTLPHFMRPAPRPHAMAGHPAVAMEQYSETFWLFLNTIENAFLVVLFYLHAYYIFPRFLTARKYLLVCVLLLAGLIAHLAYSVLISFMMVPYAPVNMRMFMGSMNYVLVCAIAYAVYSFETSRKMERRQKEREVENIKAELQFLRWQISPHFLFNVLNSLVALARKKSENLEPMIIHLSGLMRYMLYEADETKVNLENEAEYLRSFIRLQSLRSDSVLVNFHLDIPKDTHLYIEPMLLIPFVENAFKHGVDFIDQPVIDITFSVTGSTLFFKVCNKFVRNVYINKDGARGVGLINVKKRLDLLYESKHALEIALNDYYTVTLKIDLI